MTVLIYRLGSLGDTVVALPALRLIASAFPTEKRIMLTNYSRSTKAAPVAEILDKIDLIDEYLEYPLFLRDPKAILALRKKIRASGADTLVYLTSPRGRLKALRDALFFRFCGLKKSIGLSVSSGDKTKLKICDNFYEYEGARLLRTIKELGMLDLDAPQAFDLALTSEEFAEAKHALSAISAPNIIALSVGAKADVKDWGHDKWCKLIPLLAETLPGWGLVLLGAGVERERSEDLMQLWPGEKLNLCGSLLVRGSAAVLARCDIFIGHDSGPMHLAAAVGTPCVAIFSSQNWRGEWFPHGSNHKIFYTEIECQGCRLDVCIEKQKACIRAISPEDVTSAVKELQGTVVRATA